MCGLSVIYIIIFHLKNMLNTNIKFHYTFYVGNAQAHGYNGYGSIPNVYCEMNCSVMLTVSVVRYIIRVSVHDQNNNRHCERFVFYVCYGWYTGIVRVIIFSVHISQFRLKYLWSVVGFRSVDGLERTTCTSFMDRF